MDSNFAWFVVVVIGSVAILAAEHFARSLLAGQESHRRARYFGIRVVLCALALLLLCLLLRSQSFADLDVRAIALLAHTRSAGLVSVFSVVTTMGDVVPCLLLATGLGMVLFRVAGDVLRSFMLPVVVLVQVSAQFVLGKLFEDPTVDSVRPDLVIGGAGPIPSGSVSRLFSIFLVASVLWAAHSAVTARRLAAAGSLAVLVELVSRLYLGRHFVTDIVGGLLLGVLLVVAAGWFLELLARRSRQRAATGQRWVFTRHDARPGDRLDRLETHDIEGPTRGTTNGHIPTTCDPIPVGNQEEPVGCIDEA